MTSAIQQSNVQPQTSDAQASQALLDAELNDAGQTAAAPDDSPSFSDDPGSASGLVALNDMVAGLRLSNATGVGSDGTLMAGRYDADKSGSVAVGRNTYNLTDNTFNGRKLELQGTPEQYKDIDRVVIHETTDGHKDKASVTNDARLNVNTDATIIKDGSLLQASVNNRRTPDHGIAGGIGTIKENDTPGTNFDIEIDYCAEDEWNGIGPFKVRTNEANQLNDAQYHTAAKAVANVAILKYVGEVRDGATRKGNDYHATVTVEPHYAVDKGLPGAHTDPRKFDAAKFERYVKQELAAYKVPSSLVQFKGW